MIFQEPGNRDRKPWSNQRTSVQRIDPIAFIGLEMSFVPQVERVFVDAADHERGFLVTVVINQRNPDVRSAIYKKEQSIMDEMRNFDFGFHVLSRDNVDLEEIGTPTGTLAFAR